jgi:acylphosphatase
MVLDAGPEARLIRIEGMVQGVFFRKSARQEAIARGLVGLARNEDDGSVTIVVEGAPGAIDDFVAWCHHGPPRSRVERVTVEEAGYSGMAGFHIG